MRTIVVSDVSLGYGTPQILRFANSFAKRYCDEVVILEPDQPERPAVRDLKTEPNVRIQRLTTSAHPYSGEGLIEYVLMAKKFIRQFEPDVYIGASHWGMRVLANLQLRENTIRIFYCLEDAGNLWFDDCVIHQAAKLWDLVLFPEENRLRRYSSELQLRANTHAAVIYNANELRRSRSAWERNGRIFYGGLIHDRTTLAKYFPRAADMPIDAFGNIGGYEHSEDFTRYLNLPGGVSYKGYLRADDGFFETLSNYCYSIVGWMPLRFDFENAAPNKLFDAIACGVPPISAPHPQCVEIIKKWKCGLLLDDWTLESLRSTVEKAMNAVGSDFYAELVDNCRRAMEEELSWDRQFEKVVPYIEKLLPRLGLPA